MFNPNCNECVDFEFFEGNYMKKVDSSKIITKAVIETKPLQVLNTQDNVKYPTESSNASKVKQDYHNLDNELSPKRASYIVDYLSSPSSSLEKISLVDANVDSYLLNCLAYNDKVEYSDIDPLEGKFYSSDSSLSESSITTLSSDFTSVSPVLSISDSSCLSDESVADSIPDDEIKDELVGNLEGEKAVIVSCKEIVQSESDRELSQASCTEIEQSESDREELSQTWCKEIEQSENDREEHFQTNSSTASDNDKIKSEMSIDNEVGCSDYESEENTNEDISEVEANISTLEGDLEDISLASQSRSTSSKLQLCRGSSKLPLRRKDCNLTFSREKLIKIERENLILLKKIMSHAKPRAVSLNNQSFNHKKTSAAINRARQQKKIEEDNYILYSKISALGRMKKVF